MPPRESELPEGTDHIINGAMETGAGETGSSGGLDSGFVGTAATDDTGGTSGGGTSMAQSGKTKGTGSNQSDGGVVGQLKEQASSLRGQAAGRVREFAEGGKARASDALDDLSKVVSDTADSIDERLGGEYGDYARKASDAVSNFAGTLRSKDVDELYGQVTKAVQKSPAIAVGIAAVVGFTLVRLVKAGLADDGDDSDKGNGNKSSGAGA